MRRTEYVERMVEKRNARKLLVVKPDGKDHQAENDVDGWVDNNKQYLRGRIRWFGLH
jgi:hypothetical protein